MNLSLRPYLKIMSVLLGVFILAEGIYYIGVRPWSSRWGSTDAEVAMVFPGDKYIKPGSEISTRAININAPVKAVWPWIVRLGQERGGFFSYSLFENTFGAEMVNADQIKPDDEIIHVGDRFSYLANGPEGTYGTVDLVEENRIMDVGGWGFLLQPQDDQTTRLVVRYAFEVGDSFMAKVIYYGMFEQAHFIMESGMMLGIKQRAESLARKQF
jgi:hypothetical protein